MTTVIFVVFLLSIVLFWEVVSLKQERAFEKGFLRHRWRIKASLDGGPKPCATGYVGDMNQEGRTKGASTH